MNLIIDSGNTSTKIALFEHDKMIAMYANVSSEQVIEQICTHNPAYALICSVNQDGALMQERLQEYINKIYILDHLLPVPVTNGYQTPETLGKDRLAAVCGASYLFPAANSLVIDMGTCITYDFIDSQDKYYGGSISPGLQMRFKALHMFTARLPLLEPVVDIELIGKNTREAIRSGVVNGMAFEIQGTMEEYKKKFGNIHVIFCGGDANFFENKIKERIFVIPELVLIGLNRVLQYNVSTT